MNNWSVGPIWKALYLKADVQGSHYHTTMSILTFKRWKSVKGLMLGSVRGMELAYCIYESIS